MSRIDELIAELAPKGVRHVPLSAVAGYSDTRVDALTLDATTFVGVDNLLSNKGGKTDASYLPNTARLTAYEAGDILLGNIRPYLKKVWLASGAGGCSGDVLAIRISKAHRESIEPKFLYYLLSSDGFFAYNMQHAKGAKMPRGNKEAILNFRIPVPPIKVQREIVRVLDHFTQLETELEAELEARQVQYAHYRDSLLSFDNADCEWLTLSEVAIEFGRGKSKHRPRNDPKLYGGRYPFIQTGDVRSSSHLITEHSQTYNEEGLAQSKLWPRGTICITIAANIAETGILDFDACFPDSVIGMVVNQEKASQHFVEYLLQSLKENLVAKGHGSAQANINLATFENERFPFPPLKEQERIVSILDKFDTLLNDLFTGLPAELNARRKQYEYYRDKLLTFEEAAA